MDEQTGVRTNEWTNKSMYEGMDRWMNGHKAYGWIEGWTNEGVEEHTDKLSTIDPPLTTDCSHKPNMQMCQTSR